MTLRAIDGGASGSQPQDLQESRPGNFVPQERQVGVVTALMPPPLSRGTRFSRTGREPVQLL